MSLCSIIIGSKKVVQNAILLKLLFKFTFLTLPSLLEGTMIKGECSFSTNLHCSQQYDLDLDFKRIYVMGGWMNGTTSMPKSVCRWFEDKVF